MNATSKAWSEVIPNKYLSRYRTLTHLKSILMFEEDTIRWLKLGSGSFQLYLERTRMLVLSFIRPPFDIIRNRGGTKWILKILLTMNNKLGNLMSNIDT